MRTELELRVELCEAARRLWQSGRVGWSGASFTARSPEGGVLITPWEACAGHIRPDDVLLMNEASPDAEAFTVIYELRPDVQAAILASSPHALALGLQGGMVPDSFSPEAAKSLGSVASIDFCLPESEELADGLRPLLEDHKSFLISHRGALTLGASPFDAARRLDALERTCEAILLARSSGDLAPMPERALSHYVETALDGKV